QRSGRTRRLAEVLHRRRRDNDFALVKLLDAGAYLVHDWRAEDHFAPSVVDTCGRARSPASVLAPLDGLTRRRQRARCAPSSATVRTLYPETRSTLWHARAHRKSWSVSGRHASTSVTMWRPAARSRRKNFRSSWACSLI